MDYLDFELAIQPGSGRDYLVTVLHSPAGEARQTMHIPFDQPELENHLKNLQAALLRSSAQHRAVLSPGERTTQQFGQALFDALFAGEILLLYRQARELASRQNSGVRLKLRIDAPELAALPWEFMYDRDEERYLCLSVETPLVRYFSLPHPPAPLAVRPPLKVLGVIASPSGLPPLDIEREKQLVEQALAPARQSGLLELTWLPGQSRRDLQWALGTGLWHSFHFVGHAVYDQKQEEGLVALAGDDGIAEFVSAEQLAHLLTDHRTLRLVLLSANEGARGGSQDRFSSTAAHLVRAGIPAVLANQFEISDQAALEFNRSFYEALTDGLPVDAATNEARKAVSLALSNSIEWGTPVLYMQTPDGVLFDTGQPARSAARTEQAAPAPAETVEAVESVARNRPPPPSRPPAPQPASLAAALLVGINEYPRGSNIQLLRWAVADVTALAELLQGPLHIPAERITRLLDGAAKKESILVAIQQIALEVGEGQEGLIQFSGMSGHFPGAGEMPFDSAIAVADSKASDPDTFLKHTELLDALRDCKGHVVVVLDVCHDGSLMLTRNAPENMTILAAARDNEVALEQPKVGHGVFTAALLDVLRDWRPELTWGEVYLKVFGRVVDAQSKQHPMLIGDGRRRVFGGGALGDWRPDLPVLNANEKEVEVYASPALTIKVRETNQPPRLAPATFWPVRVEDSSVLFQPDFNSPLKAPTRLWTSGIEPLRLELAVEEGLLTPSDVLTLVQSPDAEYDLRIERQDDSFILVNNDGEMGARVPADQSAGLHTCLEQMALAQHMFMLENTGPDAETLNVSLSLAEPTASENAMPAGQLFTVVAANRGDSPAFISIWQMREDMSLHQLHPARSDCDILYPNATLSLQMALEDSPHRRVLLKLIATSEPHDLRMLEQDGSEYIIPTEQRDAVQENAEQVKEPVFAYGSSVGSASASSSYAPDLLPGQGLKAKLWRSGQTIRIRFLDGDPTLQERVMTIAYRLTEFAYLHFEVVREGDTEVRISFKEAGSWSYMGLDALVVAQDQPTMNFGWFTPQLDETGARQVVLREFGHMLGLVNEHQNPNANLPWNRDAVIRTFGGPPNNWSVEQIEVNMLRTYPPAQLAVAKPFDPDSIMAYPFPQSLFSGSFSIAGTRGELTETDKQTLAALYPYTPEQSYAQSAA